MRRDVRTLLVLMVALVGLIGCGRVPPAPGAAGSPGPSGSVTVEPTSSSQASPELSAGPSSAPSSVLPSSVPPSSAPPSASTSAPTAGASSSGSAAGEECEYTATGTAARRVRPPSATGVPDRGVVTVTLAMSDDLTVRFTMDRAKAPCTVHSFESLAAQGYFDKTRCHRLVDSGIFVLQCGDPTGTGSGGPGYSFADETDGSERYVAGTVAMANAGPNTNGSQFFLVYQDSPLPADYTVFGTMDAASTGAVNTIAYQGQDGSRGREGGRPNNPAEIITAKVSAPKGNAG